MNPGTIQRSALVVGCGVSGLSSAIRLQEAGFQVTIWVRELPPHTTSSIAAAIWYPYKAYPFDRVLHWGQHTFDEFCRLAECAETGVTLTPTIEVLEQPAPDPWWRSGVRDFRHARAAELPLGYRDGYVFTTPIIEMGLYLPYLMRRFQQGGGVIVERAVATLDETFGHSRTIVNCAGLGARELASDSSMYPIRGQIVRVRRPDLERAVLDEAEHGRHPLTYIVPRSQDCILGGTAEPHRESTQPEATTAAAILARARALVPALDTAEVLEHVVGLRPGRPSVRLEEQRVAEGWRIIHNYGHGGAGVTLSWGCAAEVVQLVQQ